jgi:hypothetical protein
MPPRLYASIDGVVYDFLVLVAQRPIVIPKAVTFFPKGTIGLGKLAVLQKEVVVGVG